MRPAWSARDTTTDRDEVDEVDEVDASRLTRNAESFDDGSRAISASGTRRRTASRSARVRSRARVSA